MRTIIDGVEREADISCSSVSLAICQEQLDQNGSTPNHLFPSLSHTLCGIHLYVRHIRSSSTAGHYQSNECNFIF